MHTSHIIHTLKTKCLTLNRMASLSTLRDLHNKEYLFMYKVSLSWLF